MEVIVKTLYSLWSPSSWVDQTPLVFLIVEIKMYRIVFVEFFHTKLPLFFNIKATLLRCGLRGWADAYVADRLKKHFVHLFSPVVVVFEEFHESGLNDFRQTYPRENYSEQNEQDEYQVVTNLLLVCLCVQSSYNVQSRCGGCGGCGGCCVCRGYCCWFWKAVGVQPTHGDKMF